MLFSKSLLYDLCKIMEHTSTPKVSVDVAAKNEELEFDDILSSHHRKKGKGDWVNSVKLELSDECMS